jgi:outer membrane protein OmpA-like peptidoglycan-associated protein
VRRAAALLLLAAGCVTGAALRGRADAIAQDVKLAHDQNAETCAAKDLAVAEANLHFAQIDLAQGDSFRAQEHLDQAGPAARSALGKSKDCGKVTVLIREKEPAPKVALKDSDGDGVPDIDDLCPDIPGPKENHGCPVFADRDGDGVPDDIDRCPDLPGPKDNFGCPWPDRDGDGVPDKDDLCPDEPGPADNHGCPRKMTLVVVRRDRIEIKQQVHFRPAKAVILKSSYELLRQVAQVIKDAPQIRVRIEGHTDDVGRLKTNMRVSQARADSVRDFLVKQGVDPKQLVALGYGPTHPIASNKTKAGKALNRRVEFRIINREEPALPATGGARGAQQPKEAPK